MHVGKGKSSYLERLLSEERESLEVLDEDRGLKLCTMEPYGGLAIVYKGTDKTSFQIISFKKKWSGGRGKPDIINYIRRIDSIDGQGEAFYKIQNGKLVKTDINHEIVEKGRRYKLVSMGSTDDYGTVHYGEYHVERLPSYGRGRLPDINTQLLIGVGTFTGLSILEEQLAPHLMSSYISSIPIYIGNLFTYMWLFSNIIPKMMGAEWQKDDKLKAMAKKANVKFRGIAVSPVGVANALTLPNNKVVVTKGLLDKLGGKESLSALYHEFGHIKHKHVLKGIAPAFVYIPSVLYLESINSPAAGFATIGLFMFYLSYVFGFGRYLAHKFEYTADKFASDNGFSSELAHGLAKIDSGFNGSPRRSSLTHPDTYDRIKMLGLDPAAVYNDVKKKTGKP